MLCKHLRGNKYFQSHILIFGMNLTKETDDFNKKRFTLLSMNCVE